MGKVISKDGTAIAFDKSGQGAAIILVYGAFTVRSQPTMVQLAALLAPHFTVFNYDRRGRGESGDTHPYAVEREVEDLAALIKEAGGSASVWGWSSGAALALEAAARGLAITKLALYEAPYIVDDSRPPLPKDCVTQITEMIASGRRGDAVEYFMTRTAEAPAAWVAQMRNTPMWPELEAVAHTLIYDLAIMRQDSDRCNNLSQVFCLMSGFYDDPKPTSTLPILNQITTGSSFSPLLFFSIIDRYNSFHHLLFSKLMKLYNLRLAERL